MPLINCRRWSTSGGCEFVTTLPMNRSGILSNPTQLALLETLHARLPHGVAILGHDLRLIYANPRWSDFLRRAEGADNPLPGTPLSDCYQTPARYWTLPAKALNMAPRMTSRVWLYQGNPVRRFGT